MSPLSRRRSVDPLYETGYYRLMELYAGQTDRARVLHTYHTCATVLEREVPPGAEIQELYERLQRVISNAEPSSLSERDYSGR